MHNSIQKKKKTLQNKSYCVVEEKDELKKIVDNLDFEDHHIYPYDHLWVDVPHPKLSWAHVHDNLEIGRCNKGSGTFFIDSNLYRIQPRCCEITYAGQYHSAQSNPFDFSEWNYLYIDLDYYTSFFDENVKTKIKALDHRRYDFPGVVNEKEHPQIVAIVDAIFSECENVSPDRDEVLAGLILSLLTLHSRLMIPTKKTYDSSAMMKRISPAISYMNNHYGETVTIDKLCELCFVSPATLRRDFMACSGKSPAEYLHSVRVKNAAAMLANTDKKIIDISAEVGYPTVSSFNRKFSELYGVSPREYRKSHK